MTRRRPSQQEAPMPTPLTPGPFAGGMPHSERGTIISVDALGHMYRVALNSGRDVRVGRLRSHPGDMTLLPAQTQVAVSWAFGLPYIVGVLPPEVASTPQDSPVSVTDVEGHGGNDPVLQRNMAASARAPDEPRDIMPGDFVGVGSDGASVAALRGKVAALRGGTLAKVEAFGDNDLVRIVSGLFRHVTWMGESRIVNDDGKVSYQWRGGSDQLTQTGADEGNYTIRLDVGHTGDLIKLEVTDREGRALFRFHVSPTGACELFAAGGVSQTGGRERSEEQVLRIHGRQVVEHEGTEEKTVTGSSDVTIEGSASMRVSEDYVQAIGGNSTISVVGDELTTVTGKIVSICQGVNELRATAGITVSSLAGPYAVNVTGGNATFNVGTNRFRIRASAVDSIQLGADEATSHAVKFEELLAGLGQVVTKLNAILPLIATHVHVPPTGPSAALAGIGTPLPFDISAAKSTLVKLK